MMQVHMNSPKVAVIILNWNTWQDTIECLESIFKQNYTNYAIVLIDNGSRDNSVEKISEWAVNDNFSINTKFPELIYPLKKRPIKIQQIHLSINELWFEKLKIRNDRFIDIYMILLDENYGFAKASNLGIRFSREVLQCKYFFILNNDTVIQQNVLKQLLDSINKNKEYIALQPIICNYDKPESIDNAGGKISWWGQAKYYIEPSPGPIQNITFINGCAIFFHENMLEQLGLFTEKFFFGEEDFELSLRAKRLKKKLGVVNGARIYHKISSSAKLRWGETSFRKIVIARLNRMIDMKSYYPRWFWMIWVLPVSLYFLLGLTFRTKLKFRDCIYWILFIVKYSFRYEEVPKELVDALDSDPLSLLRKF